MRDIPWEEKEKTEKSPGSMGWKIAKFHAMSFFTGIVNKFIGRAKTFDSGANERLHKTFVKGNAKLTQRISSKFSTQLSGNDYERVVIDQVFEHIKKHCSQDHSPFNCRGEVNKQQYYSDSESSDSESEDGTSIVGSTVRGRYRLGISMNAQKRVNVTHKWHSRNLSILGVSPNIYLGKTIADAHIKYTSNFSVAPQGSINVTGYTSATVGGVTYRANPYWKGEEWYDWASVRFPSTVDSRGGTTSICRGIMAGFFSMHFSWCIDFQTG